MIAGFHTMSGTGRVLQAPAGPSHHHLARGSGMSEQSTPVPVSEQPQVEYRDVPDFPGYRVGDDGSVWSCWSKSRPICVLGTTWRKLKLGMAGSKTRRPAVSLYPANKTFYVHRLVLIAFVGPCPDGMEACHEDGNVLNNALPNLRWDTPSANAADKIRHGTHKQGIQMPCAKLTTEEVLRIREEAETSSVTKRFLATKYRVHEMTIGRILKRQIWKHV